jgi:membrane protein implicated in regulation of membrane protease activity
MGIVNLMDPGHWTFWMGIGIILAILEVLDGSFFLLSLGIGCVLPALAAAAGVDSVAALVGICVAGQLVVFFSVRPLFRRITEGDGVSMNADALVGQTAYVTQDIGGMQSPGYVKINGEEWRAIGSSEATLSKGEKVVVIAVGGSTVTVTNAEEADRT